MDRRTLLKAAMCAPLVGLWGTARAAALTDKLSVIQGLGGNIVVLTSGDGLLLVDTGAPQHAGALSEQLRGKPVRTVFNTHWHPAQTGSNERLGAAGAKIIAHEKTRLYLSTDHYRPAEDRYEKALPNAAHPTEAFFTTGKTSFGGEQIEYGYLLEAHTDGDIYVHFRDSNVLAVGDVIAPDSDPVLDWFGGGWIGGRIDSLSLLLKLADDKTKIVAGTGQVVGKSALQTERDVMQAIYDRIVELIRKGYTTQDMLDAGILQGLARTFDDPKKFMYDAHKGFWAHHNTLTHDVV